jgi:hypothetical protein
VRRLFVGTLVAAVLATGCTPETPTPAPSPEGTAEDVEASGKPPPPEPGVHIEGTEVVLDRDGAVVAVLPQDEGTIEHAVLRPGDHANDTVLVLASVQDRYEIRYVIVGEDGPSDLYWLPWRLQVDEALAGLADVPPLPVWAPDGSAFAWLEWDDEGTRLRTVAWRDTPEGGNPSDDQAAYRVADLPVGAQLVSWKVDGDTPVLLAEIDGIAWRIELDLDSGDIYALPLDSTPSPRAS